MQTMSQNDRLRARPTRPASIAPSISSVLSDATTINAPVHRQRGFQTREAYLAALDDFAESKLYMPAGDRTLYGWYGGETMNDRKDRLRAEREKGRTLKHVHQQDTAAASRRRATIAVPQESAERSANATNSEQVGGGERNTPTVEGAENGGRLRRFSRVLSGRKERRKTDAFVS